MRAHVNSLESFGTSANRLAYLCSSTPTKDHPIKNSRIVCNNNALSEGSCFRAVTALTTRPCTYTVWHSFFALPKTIWLETLLVGVGTNKLATCCSYKSILHKPFLTQAFLARRPLLNMRINAKRKNLAGYLIPMTKPTSSKNILRHCCCRCYKATQCPRHSIFLLQGVLRGSFLPSLSLSRAQLDTFNLLKTAMAQLFLSAY